MTPAEGPRGPVPLVRVIRSGVVESVHLGSVAVADANGRLIAFAGDPDRVAFARSAMKPLQAAVSLGLAGTDLPDDEVAVAAGSHFGEPRHVEVVRRLLSRAGLDESALRCPPSWPLDEGAARAAHEPAPILHNCSGKHAAMLLACVRQGWELSTYPAEESPLQQRILEAVELAAGRPGAIGVDGCGVPVHALPLTGLATLYARLSIRDRLGELEPPTGRVVEAMGRHPYLVEGAGSVSTALMQTNPRIAAKGGAEGLETAAVLDRGLGVAVKIEDGAFRAAAPAILRALSLIGAVDALEEEPLSRFAHPPVMGGGRRVGDLVADFELTPKVRGLAGS